jgi:hypothetical protein
MAYYRDSFIIYLYHVTFFRCKSMNHIYIYIYIYIYIFLILIVCMLFIFGFIQECYSFFEYPHYLHINHNHWSIKILSFPTTRFQICVFEYQTFMCNCCICKKYLHKKMRNDKVTAKKKKKPHTHTHTHTLSLSLSLSLVRGTNLGHEPQVVHDRLVI